MIERIGIRGFKSLTQLEGLRLPQLAVLFGPNAAGKSNFLDAIQALSRIGTARTLADVFHPPFRGRQTEAFSFPEGGLPQLLRQASAEFEIEVRGVAGGEPFEYRAVVSVAPRSGSLSMKDELLSGLRKDGGQRGKPRIAVEEGSLIIRPTTKGRPIHEPIMANHSALSDPRWSGKGFELIEACRLEFMGWWTYYLDPALSMRQESSPADVRDIGVVGQAIAPFLYRLRAEEPKRYAAVKRTLQTLIPDVEDLNVDLDEKRGVLDILVRQGGTDFSSRVVSEGTLRVLALCAIAVNPWAGSLVAFEEPENGVHPRRIERIAELLVSMSLQRGTQVLVTTHSPVFCAAMLRRAKEHPDRIGLFHVGRNETGTTIERFEPAGPLFDNTEIAGLLADRGEEAVFEGLVLRGYLDD